MEDKMVSIAQAWKRDAKLEGRQEGEFRKQIEMAKRMLQKRLNVDLISEITGLSIDKIKRLQ